MDNYEVHPSASYRALMTGLFVGLFATVVCLLFNLVYRRSTGFGPTDIINIATLTFGINLAFPLIGLLFDGFRKWFKGGERAFTILLTLLFAIFIWRALGTQLTDNALLNREFRTLLIGVLLILGASAAFLLPFLYHNRQFEDHVV
ncbi:MAG: hypothetical protein EOO15_24155 [Chitinophagaceae bacterium]|nr:MAG: hypothetical protein EOO15_24155 [Chitinophagaceae bacterium]